MSKKTFSAPNEYKTIPINKSSNNDALNLVLEIYHFILLIFNIIFNNQSGITNLIYSMINAFKGVNPFFVLLCYFSYTFAFKFTHHGIKENYIYSIYFPKANNLTVIKYENLKKNNKIVPGSPVTEPVDLFSNYIFDSIQEEDFLKDIPLTDIMKNFEDSSFIKNNSFKYMKTDLYKKYGNKTLLKINLDDLEKMVRSSLISERQANFFWGVLLMEKTDIKNKINYKDKCENEEDEEFFAPVIEAILVCPTLFLGYIIGDYLDKSRYKNSIILNAIIIILSFYILKIGCSNSLFLGCSFYFCLMYFFKRFIDSVYVKLKFQKKDFNIFSTNLGADNLTQFFLKFIFLLLLTVFSFIISKILFESFVAYLSFYFFLFTLFVFLSNCVDYVYNPMLLSPIKDIILFSLGILNFMITRFHNILSHFYFQQYTLAECLRKDGQTKRKAIIEVPSNSFCLISDLFTLLCIHYLEDFLSQNIKVSFLNISNHKSFTSEDVLWLIGYIIPTVILYIGVEQNDYMCLIISLYMTRILLSNFNKIFNIKLVKTVTSLLTLRYLLFNYLIMNSKDSYLFKLFGIEVSSFKLLMLKGTILLQILRINLLNLENLKRKGNNKKTELEEIAKEAAEEILRKVEMVSKMNNQNNNPIINKKQKKFKTFQIQVFKPDKHYGILKYFYTAIEIFLNFMGIIMIFYIFQNTKIHWMIYILYLILLLILFFKGTTTIFRYETSNEYHFIYCLKFIASIRLLVISYKVSSFLYLLSHLNLIVLIIIYCGLTEKKNYGISTLSSLYLIIAAITLNSNFLILESISFNIIPFVFNYIGFNNIDRNAKKLFPVQFIDQSKSHAIINNNTENEIKEDINLNEEINSENEQIVRKENKRFDFILPLCFPLFTILIVNIYGVKNIFIWMHYLNEAFFKKYLINMEKVNIFFLAKDTEILNELNWIKRIINLIK
ncbi:MAG: hypothetical protein MJ252_09260 [archaeon]|nr:hypothetical protein [archaeon]